ncbi:MAG: hypothetical protein AB7G39_02515, partial [Alphaproteobacteria bacterium]
MAARDGQQDGGGRMPESRRAAFCGMVTACRHPAGRPAPYAGGQTTRNAHSCDRTPMNFSEEYDVV